MVRISASAMQILCRICDLVNKSLFKGQSQMVLSAQIHILSVEISINLISECALHVGAVVLIVGTNLHGGGGGWAE